MYVYKITNLINNKIYIGITKNYKERIAYHKMRAFQPNHKEYNKVLYKAFRKYGLDNFSFEILEQNLTEDEARIAEQAYIKALKTNSHECGYNMTPDGELDCAHGENVNTAVMTDEEIIIIRQRRNQGERVADVYNDFKHKIGYSDFGRIWRNENWKHIDIPMTNNMLPSGASLDVPTILLIKELYKDGWNAHQIATELNIEYRKVWRICTGRTYKNIN